MTDQFLFLLFRQLAVLILIAALGAVAVRWKIMDDKGLASLSGIIVKIALPAMVFSNLLANTSREDVLGALPALAWAFGIMLAAMGAALLVCKLLKIRGNQLRVYNLQSTFGNIGFMGTPLIVGLYPEDGMLYVSLYLLANECLLWTIGYAMSYPEKSKLPTFGENARRLINPCIIVTLIAGFCIFTGFQLPQVVLDAVSSVGKMASPLGLIYIGGTISGTVRAVNFRNTHYMRDSLVMVFVKMLALPALVYFLMGAGGMGQHAASVMTLLAAMPCMVVTVIICRVHKSDGDYAAWMLLATTAGCIVTLPLLGLIMSLFPV